MNLTDTHTHLYLEQFDNDRDEVIKDAKDNGVRTMLLPNINSNTADKMLEVCEQYKGYCLPMMGLHPTSVKGNFREELDLVIQWHERMRFYAVGEIGIDLYWDRTFIREQEEAFRVQIRLARQKNLPIVIHSRDSFNEIFSVMDDEYTAGLTGVFHCFTGNLEQAKKILGWGFKLGIGGVVTFKNSGLESIIREIDLGNIVLETDAPFLAPVPYRGKRNESAYIRLIARKVADIKKMPLEQVAEVTTQNAKQLFNF